MPVPPKELSVFDEQHPLPKDAAEAAELRQYLTETSDKQIAALATEGRSNTEEVPAGFRHGTDAHGRAIACRRPRTLR